MNNTLGVLVLGLGSVVMVSSGAVVPSGLTCEYRAEPVGVDAMLPRLGWRLTARDGETNVFQSAYRVQVASSCEALNCGKADLWDSGEVASAKSSAVYRGKALGSSMKCWWRVKTWQKGGGVSSWSEPASWVNGLFAPTDWKAKWIAANPATRDAKTGEDFTSPAFATEFVAGGKVSGAVMHVAAPGFCEVWLNGRRVGDNVLDPSPTDYTKTVLYVTHELDDLLIAGTNRIVVLLGHGWYDVRAKDAWDFNVAPWRDRPCLRLQIETADAQGHRETLLTSDESWRQVASPVGFDDVRESGEVVGAYDQRCPDFSAQRYSVSAVKGPTGKLRSQKLPGAKVVRDVVPLKVAREGRGWRVDFPEEVVGWIRLKAKGLPKGRVVAAVYDEKAIPEGKWRSIGKFYKENASHAVGGVEGAFQKDRFVAEGKGEETFEPRFTWKGFRSVFITGLERAPEEGDIVGRYVRTAYEETGRIETSNPDLNALLAAGVRSYHANFTDGVPTDCPTREKLGWTGDAAHIVELGQYICENTAGYEKWLGDLIDSQRSNGLIPGIVPSSGWGYDGKYDGEYNGPIWDCALAFVPWTLWTYRGDERALTEASEALIRLVDFNAKRKVDEDGLVAKGIGEGGDWWPPDWKNMPSMRYGASVYQYATAKIAAKSAAQKGMKEEAMRMEEYAEKMKSAINRRFCKDGQYDCGNQAAQACALAFGLVPKEMLAAARERMVAAVKAKDCHFDCGFIGMKHLLRELSRAGRTDLALTLLLQKTHPTLMLMVQKTPGSGLWDEWTENASSLCHAMFADTVAWAHQYLAGIRPLDAPEGGATALFDGAVGGMAEFRIAPEINCALDGVSASTMLPAGEVKSEWRRENGKVTFKVTIPPNTRAKVRLPVSKAEKWLGSGTYAFEE